MITSTFGKIFLDAYNEHFCTKYDAKSFFIEKYYPLFFDDEKYMMTAGNSPLENPKLSWDKMIKGDVPFETTMQRKERFDKFIEKVESNEADASIAIGYPSIDVLATTSGQVSNQDFNTTKEDVYLSWIGGGLGVGVQGGMSILLNNKQILLDIFEGWAFYRRILTSIPELRGNQIGTWNGQWLAHRYSRMYVADNPLANLKPFKTNNDGIMNIEVQTWTKVLIGITRNFSNPQIIGYVYNYGQTNTTIAFIPFFLEQIRRPLDLYQKLFGIDDGSKAERLWGTAYGFAISCQAGSIGLQALEPKGLKEFMEQGKTPKYNNDDEEIKISINTYKIWIMAMLNNQDLWDKSQEFAVELHKFAQSGEKSKTSNSRKVDAITASTNKKMFIESLVDLVSDAENKDKVEEIAKIINTMPTDNVPYFLTLVRFNYAAINNIKK